MTEEFDIPGVCTGTWWSSSNGMFSGCSLPGSSEIFVDISGFEWHNIDTLDAKTYNESHVNTSASLGDPNLDFTSQVYVSNQSNFHEEEKLNPINSLLEGLFDSSEQLSVPNYAKSELLESFHFFDDVFMNESRTASVFHHEIRDKLEEDMQPCKSPITCNKRVSEKSEELEDIESSPRFKRPRLETPSHFPSFKVRKEKLGDRITALQQLVSPFGKTDTASVLHDAVEYIRFLQEQIAVSSNAHLNLRGSGEQKQWSDKSSNNTRDQDQDCSPRHDLRSRGLCLMPISSTFSASPQHLDTSSFWN